PSGEVNAHAHSNTIPFLDEHRECLPAAYRRGRRELGAGLVDGPVRKALEHLLERHAALEASQRRTEAVVQPVTEGGVPAGLAVNAELVGGGEPPLVPIGRPD